MLDDPNRLRYIKELREYLESFIQRAQPLLNLQDLKDTAVVAFEKLWDRNMFPGWEKDGDQVPDERLYCVPCKLIHLLSVLLPQPS